MIAAQNVWCDCHSIVDLLIEHAGCFLMILIRGIKGEFFGTMMFQNYGYSNKGIILLWKF